MHSVPDPPLSEPLVILGNGRFPTHPVPLEKLKSAGTLICLDGAADRAAENGFTPSIIMGDLDSLEGDPTRFNARIIRRKSQENTDLEKALDWCVESGAGEVTLLGLSGDREDHTVASLFAMKENIPDLEIVAMTDFFTVWYVRDQREFSASSGQKVSLIALPDSTVVTTQGLEFELTDETLGTAGHGVSNVALNGPFSVEAKGGGVFVFLGHPS